MGQKNDRSAPLKWLIGILAVFLLALLLVVFLLTQSEPPQPTEPFQPQTLATSPTTEPTAEATEPPTTAPTEPVLTDWVESDGKIYYYADGIPLTGPQNIDGTLYCFGSDGALLSEGWQEIDGATYYLNADGSAYYGWLAQDDDLYYLRSDGTMARGCLNIDGFNYFFTETGRHIYVVNPWNYVPADYEPELVTLPTAFSKSGSIVDASCHAALVQMMTDCIAAGHDVYIISSHRTQAYQQKLFDNQVKKQMNKGYSREEAQVIAATISAIPGTSEHQLGLAVDIIDTAIWDLVEEQENLPGQKWLMENCWRYGFILRYPKDKTDETGIIYEPWHYRYVGIELATVLYESGQTLEAYLAALS